MNIARRRCKMRFIVSAISIAICLIAAAFCEFAMAATPDYSIKSRIELLPAGTEVEIELRDHSRFTGKLGRVAGDRLELEIEQGGQIKVTQFSIADIASVKRHLPFGSDLEVSASMLGSVVLDRKINLMTRDGTYVEGKVLHATEQRLLIEVSKSEPKGRLRGGEASIPTADIAVVHMKKNGSIAAPVALGVVAGFLAAVGTSYIAYEACASEGAAAGLVIAGMAGGATAGAYAGHEAVKKTVTIRVVP
jgi:hypothetical protein